MHSSSSGDYGWFLGDLQQWHKRSNFERAGCSPLIVCGPGVAASARCERCVETLDLFPAKRCDLREISQKAERMNHG